MSAATSPSPARLTQRLTPGVVARLDDATLFETLFRHGSLEVEVYKPRGTDQQTPHARDEVYVVISGHGRFECDGDVRDFAPGEVLFVPARVPHRFVEFGDDFATWVFFYGPEGGEQA